MEGEGWWVLVLVRILAVVRWQRRVNPGEVSGDGGSGVLVVVVVLVVVCCLVLVRLVVRGVGDVVVGVGPVVGGTVGDETVVGGTDG